MSCSICQWLSGVPEMDGDFPVMESGATWTPLNNVRNSLIPGGWWLVAGGWLRCAGGASGAWPRPGHRNHPSYILGNGGGQHWRLWDRHCTCPVIAPSITCPHVASLLRTILDSLGSTAHNLIPLQCAAWNIGVSTVWSCVGVRPRYCLYDHDKTICLFVS